MFYGNSSLVIAPIGTCRIHTPSRKGSTRYPVKVQLARNYGFVHTSSEALQQLRFMLCDLPIPADVQTLTFRPGVETEAYAKPHVPADVYVVELSSKKLLSVDGYPVQINYMARHFGDFFADRQRARKFWSMSSESQQAARLAWLETDSAFRRLAQNDRDLLARILRREQSDEDLEREMNEIAALVGKDKLVFVTHVDAAAPDNTLIEQRHQFILSVRAIAVRMGVPCYDPTPLMTEMGQTNAMENGGLDLTHYTDAFADRLFADWYENFFLPRMDATGELAQAQASIAPEVLIDDAASIEAAWNAGQLREASRRVRAVLRCHPEHRDHCMLLARMQMELGDYEGVLRVLEAPVADGGANEQAQEMLMRAYYVLGKYSEAGRLASAMLADEIETPEILRISADSATHLGDDGKAVSAWKRLFRVSPDEADAETAATAVLDLFKSAGDVEGAACWADEVRQTLPSHVPSFAAQWEGKLAAEDRQGLMALADDPIRVPEMVAADLVQRAATQGFALPAALFAISQNLLEAPGFRTQQWFAQISPQWLGEGLAALDSGNLLVAADRIQASGRVTPNAGPTIRAKLTLERRLRRDARLALAAKDYAGVTAIAGVALSTGARLSELDSLLGRAADALGDTETALRHLRRVADEAGAPLSARIHLARVAVRGQRYGEAIDAYCKVAANESAEEAEREDARHQLTVLRNRAVRFARELLAREQHEEAWRLLENIETASPDGTDLGQEKRRVIAALHSKLRTLDPGNAGERLAISKTILRLQSDDVIGLKAAAGAEMRLHRFAQALPYWNALRDKADNTEQIDNNVRRCLTWIERTQRNADARLTEAA